MKRIPKKYMYSIPDEPGGGRFRKPSPLALKIRETPLEEIECPACKEKMLYISTRGYSDVSYVVRCDKCDWEVPFGELHDCGEVKCLLDDWLEVFEFLGCPKEAFLFNENLPLLLYPEILDEAYNNERCLNAGECSGKCLLCDGSREHRIECGDLLSEEAVEFFRKAFEKKKSEVPCKKKTVIDREELIEVLTTMCDSEFVGNVFTLADKKRLLTLIKNLGREEMIIERNDKK